VSGVMRIDKTSPGKRVGVMPEPNPPTAPSH
jgi:hypothetical protein